MWTLFILVWLFNLVIQTICDQSCDIVIAGGTLASLAAALHSPPGYRTCLIEPTFRLGGQLGDEGVWAIDFNWLYQKDYPDHTIAYSPSNNHPLIVAITQKCNTGNCWVSRNCFQYSCIEPIIKQELSKAENLTILYGSMVKSVQKQGSRIVSLEVITRKQIKQDCRHFSQSVQDWYSRQNSQYYAKSIEKVTVGSFVIEATQYGDVLALANASYRQGTKQSNVCGQSTVFGFQQIYNQSKIQQQPYVQHEGDDFSLAGYTAEQLWRYRRLVGSGTGIKAGQITLQNWNGPGNDYRGGYIFIDAKGTISDWKGGLNFTSLKEAEDRALRFHDWFRQVSNASVGLYKNQTKTCKGTTRLPYIRDGRRSVGYQNFEILPGDVTGNYIAGGPLTATVFPDRVALGMYNMDLHSIVNCNYSSYPQNNPLPFFLPLRAFSNQDYQNLIPAGRAMSQQFFVSSATRTHATETNSGVASMIIALYMRSKGIRSIWALIGCRECWFELQQYIRQVMPLQWTIGGGKYPAAGRAGLLEG